MANWPPWRDLPARCCWSPQPTTPISLVPLQQAIIELAVGIHFALQDRELDQIALLPAILRRQSVEFGLQFTFAFDSRVECLTVTLRRPAGFIRNAPIKGFKLCAERGTTEG